MLDRKGLSLVLGIGIMLDSLLVAWSIKGDLESGRYVFGIISCVLIILLVFLIRYFINYALRREEKIEIA